MDYRKLLERGYEVEQAAECPPQTRHAYLADYIFDFTTYDGAMSDLFGRKAVEVCAALCDGKTYEYIENAENYQWYLLMVNMSFFDGRLDWGTSIRGAWWDYDDKTLDSCGLWAGDGQVTELEFTREEWLVFVRAVVAFADAAPPASRL
jgi:hypothetical protein